MCTDPDKCWMSSCPHVQTLRYCFLLSEPNPCDMPWGVSYFLDACHMPKAIMEAASLFPGRAFGRIRELLQGEFIPCSHFCCRTWAVRTRIESTKQ